MTIIDTPACTTSLSGADAPALFESPVTPASGMLCGWKAFRVRIDTASTVHRPGGTRQLRGDAHVDR